jgi:histidyl-tRNA synthetase
MMWEQKEIPATWFYTDTALVIDMIKRKNIAIKNKDSIDLFIIQLWDEAKKIVLPISIQAREAWINTVVSLWTPSIKEQMLKSQRLWSKFVVMVWIMEARNWIFQVRDNTAWTQKEIKKEDLIDYIIWKIWKESLDFYCPAKDLIQE